MSAVSLVDILNGYFNIQIPYMNELKSYAGFRGLVAKWIRHLTTNPEG